MDKILLIGCRSEVVGVLGDWFGDRIHLETAIPQGGIRGFKMVVIEAGEDRDDVLHQIRKIRYACKFRKIPLIVVKNDATEDMAHHYIIEGATEALSLKDAPAACRQILKGYLIPDRQPLDREMKYLSPFVNNTIQVLKTMAGMDATFKEVYFSNDLRIFGDISGIIGLSGQAEGTVIVTFYWNLARTIIARMVKVDPASINAELIHDGVGELVNMISGTTKTDLVGTPYHFELSLPTVVVGSGHQIGHPDEASIAVLLFEIGQEPFALQVSLKPRQ